MSKSTFERAITIQELIDGITAEGFTYRLYTGTAKPDVDENNAYFAPNEAFAVLNQNGCERFVTIKIKVEVSESAQSESKKKKSKKNKNKKAKTTSPEIWSAPFLHGQRSTGAIMNSPSDLIAAPCPPYCNGGED